MLEFEFVICIVHFVALTLVSVADFVASLLLVLVIAYLYVLLAVEVIGFLFLLAVFPLLIAGKLYDLLISINQNRILIVH